MIATKFASSYKKTFLNAAGIEETVVMLFTEQQAQSANSDLYREGVVLSVAEKLVQKWNRESRVSGSGNKYSVMPA